MNADQILEKVKQAFNDIVNPAPAPTPAPTPVALMKANLKDGTEVEVDKLEVGGVVTIAGNPAPVGEHYLEDGTKITLGDNGVIMEIEAPAQAPAPDSEMDMMKQKFAALEAKFAAAETKYAAIEKTQEAINNMMTDVLKFADLLVKQPAAKPDEVVKVPNRFSIDENFAKAITSKK